MKTEKRLLSTHGSFGRPNYAYRLEPWFYATPFLLPRIDEQMGHLARHDPGLPKGTTR